MKFANYCTSQETLTLFNFKNTHGFFCGKPNLPSVLPGEQLSSESILNWQNFPSWAGRLNLQLWSMLSSVCGSRYSILLHMKIKTDIFFSWVSIQFQIEMQFLIIQNRAYLPSRNLLTVSNQKRMLSGRLALYQINVLPRGASGGIGRKPNPGFVPIILSDNCHLGFSVSSVCQKTANNPAKNADNAI